MPAQGTDPFSTAVLVGFIVALLGVIYRELRDSRDKRLADKDEQIKDRDERIEKLEADVEKMAERSSSLAVSAERMLNYFLDREASPRDEEPAPPRGRR